MAKLLFVGLLLTAATAASGGCGSGLERPAPSVDTAPPDADLDAEVAPDDTDTAVDDTAADLADTDDSLAPDLGDGDEPDSADAPDGDTIESDTNDGDTGRDSADTHADPCEGLPDDSTCDDLNACTIGERCLAGRCAAETALSCDDGNPCTDDTCRPTEGCVYLSNLALCDDGDPCTTRDRCAAGLCRPGVFACDDNNSCTRDTCGPDGACTHIADDSLGCDDGSACTSGDRCEGGLCRPGGEDGCAAASPCTETRCGEDGRTCLSTNLDGLSCDDGDACTAGDQCQGGLCRPGLAIRCGWDSECALFRCDRRDGCILETPLAAGRTCSDDDRCTTGDRCDGAGFCVPQAPAECDDGNPCTEDSCDGTWGCSYVSTTGPCDDQSRCTTNDACQFGQCRGSAIACNDQNACTADSCDPLVGCQFLPVVCDDGNPCTTDLCDPALGCVHTASACPVGLIEIDAVGVGDASPGTVGLGQWVALRSQASVPLTMSGWLIRGDGCDCEAELSDLVLAPGEIAFGLRQSDPLPTPDELAPGGPASLEGFVFEFGELGDETVFSSGDVLELVDPTGAVVSTFVVE